MLLVLYCRKFAVAGLVGCLGCSPGIGTPDVQWGDPVGNGAWITLETQRVGRARVQVEVGDDQWTTAWGDQGLKHAFVPGFLRVDRSL